MSGVCVPTDDKVTCDDPVAKVCTDKCEFDYQLSGGGNTYNQKFLNHGDTHKRLSPENRDNLLQCDDETIPADVKKHIDPNYSPCTAQTHGTCDDWKAKQIAFNIREAGHRGSHKDRPTHRRVDHSTPLGSPKHQKDEGFTKCVFEKLGIQKERETLLKGTKIIDTFKPYHRIVNKLMNMSVSDLNGCDHRIQPNCNHGQGYSGPILSLPSVVIDVLTASDDSDPESKETHRGLREQLRDKIPLMMNNLVKVADDYERGQPGCDGPSNKTALLEQIYGGTTISLDVGEFIEDINLLSMSDDVITDINAISTVDKMVLFGMKLLNFVAIAIVVYMFLKLLMS